LVSDRKGGEVEGAFFEGKLRKRPIGTCSVPLTATGVSSRKLASRSFGTTLTQGFASASICSISSTADLA